MSYQPASDEWVGGAVGTGMSERHDTKEVYIVDDDPAVRQIISLVLAKHGYQIAEFADGEAALAAARIASPRCILLDLKLGQACGIEVLRQLRADGCSAPVLMISGKGRIPEAVESLKLGADDFIEKPFAGSDLVARVAASIAKGERARIAKAPYLPGHEPLTRRERQVMEYCVKGANTKEIAQALDLSPRTIEDHRANLMRKLGARNTADLVRIVLAQPGDAPGGGGQASRSSG